MSRRWPPLHWRGFVIGFFVAWLLFGWIGLGSGRVGLRLPASQGFAEPGGGNVCPEAYGRFVGLHDGRVAVFAGSPDGCRVLVSVQPWSVAELPDFLHDDLERGIAFQRDDELFQIMEGLAAP